jgi:hypothetical protein
LTNLTTTLYAYGKDPISTWYSRKIHLTQDRLQAYKEFDDMDTDDLVVAALDLYAEDCCLAGDVKISLVNGTEVPIQDLVGNPPFWVYSYDLESKKIVPGKAIVSLASTRELVEVMLDNNEKIRCTPDHPFLMRDGTYHEAQHLQPGDSLMPFYRFTSDEGCVGYEMLLEPDEKKWHYTHRYFAAPKPYGCTLVHHRNFNSKDNSPDNLRWMSKADHSSLHSTGHVWSDEAKQKARLSKLGDLNPMKREDVRQKMREAKKKFYVEHPEVALLLGRQAAAAASEARQNWPPERNEDFRETMSSVGKKSWADPDYRRKMTFVGGTCSKGGLSLRGISKKSRWSVERYQQYLAQLRATNTPEKLQERGRHISEAKRAAQIEVCVNHKVLSVVFLPGVHPTYDLTVDKYHNFALTAGVFTHNTQIDPTTGKRIWVEADDEEVEKLCNDLLERVNADEQVFSIARELAKYGNSFGAVVQKEREDGTPGEIVNVVAAPVYALSRIEDDEGRLIGFCVAPIEQLGSALTLAQPADLSQGKPTDPPWSFVHWRLLGKERVEAYGTSYLWAARHAYRRLRMSEDALLIYRLRRSPDRFVFQIKGLSGMSAEDRSRTMRKIRQELNKKHLINPETGNVRSEMEPLGGNEDIIVDDEAITVNRLQGSMQVNQVFDVEYFRKRFLGALKIPADYMGFSDAKSGFIAESPLAYQDINFARVINRLQQSTMQGYALLCQINLAWVGIDPRSARAKFTIHMNPVSSLDEKNRLELEKTRAETLDILQRIGKTVGIDTDQWYAYLLQRSGIPTHLLRTSAKSKNDLLKGKVVVQSASRSKVTPLEESRVNDFEKRIRESTALEGALKENFFIIIRRLPQIFNTQGPNTYSSAWNHNMFGEKQTPEVKLLNEAEQKATGKRVLLGSMITEWRSEAKKAEIKGIKNLMTETIAKLKGAEDERLRAAEAAEKVLAEGNEVEVEDEDDN